MYISRDVSVLDSVTAHDVRWGPFKELSPWEKVVKETANDILLLEDQRIMRILSNKVKATSLWKSQQTRESSVTTRNRMPASIAVPVGSRHHGKFRYGR